MLQVDGWLSTFFTGGAYRYLPPFDEVNFPTGFFYTKISHSELPTAKILQSQGFQLTELLLQFSQSKPRQVRPLSTYRIRYAEKKDESSVVSIARTAFSSSRFHTDRNIETQVANRIKAEWVANFFNGKRGTHMIVAEGKDLRLEGFLLLVGKTIDLIATSPDQHGKGIGSSMIDYANQEIGFLTAGTQSTNHASVRLYQKMGFELGQIQLVFHKHVPNEK